MSEHERNGARRARWATCTARRTRRSSVREVLAQAGRECRRAAALRRPDRLRAARGGARCWPREMPAAVEGADRRRARQPRLRVAASRTRSGRSSATAGVQLLDGDAVRGAGRRLRRGQGVRRRLRPGDARRLGRARRSRHSSSEAVDEALKLESALARLRDTPQRIAVLHYAPIQATVEGEPVEIFPFLGCSRLEEPLNRYPVTAVFHGHAHRGSPRAGPAPASRSTTCRCRC